VLKICAPNDSETENTLTRLVAWGFAVITSLSDDGYYMDMSVLRLTKINLFQFCVPFIGERGLMSCETSGTQQMFTSLRDQSTSESASQLSKQQSAI